MRNLVHIIYCTDKGIVLLSLFVISVFCAVYKFLYQSKKYNNVLTAVALCLCALAALYPSVFVRIGSDTREILLEPFRSLKIYFNTGYEEWIRVCVMNVAMFYPLGCAFSCFNDKIKIKPWVFILAAFVFSLIIEVLQYVFSLGVSETDDVINNTLGAALGYFVTYLFYKLVEKSAKKE